MKCKTCLWRAKTWFDLTLLQQVDCNAMQQAEYVSLFLIILHIHQVSLFFCLLARLMQQQHRFCTNCAKNTNCSRRCRHQCRLIWTFTRKSFFFCLKFQYFNSTLRCSFYTTFERRRGGLCLIAQRGVKRFSLMVRNQSPRFYNELKKIRYDATFQVV